MKVLKTNHLMPCEKLKFNTEYQRMIEPARKKKVEQSITENGYWPHEVVIVNDKYEVVDGQHRVVAAMACGVSEITVCVQKFDSIKEEADFFQKKNNWNTALKPIDFWHARYMAGHPIADLLYKMNEDKGCLLCSKIAVKGHETLSYRFTIASVLSIINGAAFNRYDNWSRDKSDELMTSDVYKHSYAKIKNRVNYFVQWFYDCFGNDKKSNPVPYRHDMIRALIRLFIIIERQNWMSTTPKYRRCVNKLKKFIFADQFLTADHYSKVMLFVAHLNKNLQKDRLKMDQ